MKGCMKFPNFGHLTLGQNKSEFTGLRVLQISSPDVNSFLSTTHAVLAEISRRDMTLTISRIAYDFCSESGKTNLALLFCS